jgi:DNA end-binding protein Ku
MIAIAGAIIRQRTAKFDPTAFRDRYQDALRELIEAKMKGLLVKPRPVSEPAPVVDLMAALKRSLAQEQPGAARHAQTGKRKETKAATDRRQAALLLPLTGGQKRQIEPATTPTVGRTSRRKKA